MRRRRIRDSWLKWDRAVTANDIIRDARVARVRELKAELAATKAQQQAVEAERDALMAHFALALVALRDFEQVGPDGHFCIVDGWNAILRGRNVSKLTSEEISGLKAKYLTDLEIVQPPKGTREGDLRQPTSGNDQPLPGHGQQPTTVWIVFDGAEENSYCSGSYRVTYTGGTGPHRADRLILDYVHAAKLLGLDTARITVETADKALAKKVGTFGAKVR